MFVRLTLKQVWTQAFAPALTLVLASHEHDGVEEAADDTDHNAHNVSSDSGNIWNGN